jgi:hypothetical protein
MLHSIKRLYCNRLFEFVTRGLEKTPKLESNPNASCEIHTMLGSADLIMYILAIKSLLSYYNDIAVVVHSDGSLTSKETDHIRRHIEGVRFVLHYDADQRAAQAFPQSSLLGIWRNKDAAYRRLIDIELWRQKERVIILDSDVLTNLNPVEIVKWIHTGTRPFLLGQPPRNPSIRSKPSAHVQAAFLQQVPQLSDKLGLPALFLQGTTAGFCGYFGELALDRTERALSAALEMKLPMEQWGGDQCLVIYLLSVAGANRLPAELYFNYEPSLRAQVRKAHVIHFLGTYRFKRFVYPRLAFSAVCRLRSVEQTATKS